MSSIISLSDISSRKNSPENIAASSALLDSISRGQSSIANKPNPNISKGASLIQKKLRPILHKITEELSPTCVNSPKALLNSYQANLSPKRKMYFNFMPPAPKIIQDPEYATKKNTLKVFLKPTDIRIALGASLSGNHDTIKKNTSLGQIKNIHNKMKEESARRMLNNRKGFMYTNELWSAKYYEQVTSVSHLKKNIEGFDKLALKNREQRINDIAQLFASKFQKNGISKVYHDMQKEITEKIKLDKSDDNLSKSESYCRPFSKGTARQFSRGTIFTASTNIFSSEIPSRLGTADKIEKNNTITISHSRNNSALGGSKAKQKEFVKKNYINVKSIIESRKGSLEASHIQDFHSIGSSPHFTLATSESNIIKGNNNTLDSTNIEMTVNSVRGSKKDLAKDSSDNQYAISVSNKMLYILIYHF